MLRSAGPRQSLFVQISELRHVDGAWANPQKDVTIGSNSSRRGIDAIYGRRPRIKRQLPADTGGDGREDYPAALIVCLVYIA